MKTWVSMANGPPVDEQKVLRGFPAFAKAEGGAGVKMESIVPQLQLEAETNAFIRSTESDDEYDPNDEPPPTVVPRIRENVPHIGTYRSDIIEDEENFHAW